VVYVIKRGWHTDIGLPVATMQPPLAVLAQGFPGAQVLTFGFGERQFLLTRRRTFGLMLSALLPSASAVLMTALGTTPQAAFGSDQVVTLHVSQDALRRIEASLWAELEKPPAGKPSVLAQGPYPGSVFYASRDTYDGLFTCNTWTAATLRDGGLPIPAAGILFANQVMAAARRIAESQASMGDR
jgi:uncharacterized protein (TIGR02117 family)